MNERLRQFADALAVERERSNVSAETLACIRAIVLERETVPEQLEEAAQRIVAGLSDENLAELILTGSKVRWRSKSGGLSATSERSSKRQSHQRRC